MIMYCTNCRTPLNIDRNCEGGFIVCPGCKTLNRIPSECLDESGDMNVRGGRFRAFPGIYQAIFLVLGVYAFMLAFYTPVGIIDAIAEPGLVDNIFIEGLVTLFSFSAVIFLGFRKTRESFDSVFPLTNFNYSIIIPLLLTVAGSTILISDIDNLVRLFLPAPAEIIAIFEDLFSDPLRAFLLAVVIAPLTEEFLCRGLILNGFLKNYPVNKAIIVSAAIFSFMHLNPWQFIGAFFYGLLFAWLVVKSGSLWPALIGHAFANFMPLLVINILGLKVAGFSEGVTFEPVLQPWWFDLCGLILALAGFTLLKIILAEKYYKSDDSPRASQR